MPKAICLQYLYLLSCRIHKLLMIMSYSDGECEPRCRYFLLMAALSPALLGASLIPAPRNNLLPSSLLMLSLNMRIPFFTSWFWRKRKGSRQVSTGNRHRERAQLNVTVKARVVASEEVRVSRKWIVASEKVRVYW